MAEKLIAFFGVIINFSQLGIGVLLICNIVFMTLYFIVYDRATIVLRTRKVMDKIKMPWIPNAMVTGGVVILLILLNGVIGIVIGATISKLLPESIRTSIINILAYKIFGILRMIEIVILPSPGQHNIMVVLLVVLLILLIIGTTITVIGSLCSAFLSRKIEKYFTRNTKPTFKDSNGNLYTFENVSDKSRMIIMDKEGNVLSTNHIDYNFIKSLKIASPKDSLVFSYVLTKIPQDSIQHISKIHMSQQDHLIIQLLEEKTSQNFLTYISLLLSVIIETFLFIRYQKTPMLCAMSLTALLLLSSFVNQRILQYRVNSGLYGTCAAEAKEIIAFILEWRKKNSNSDNDLPKLVFKEEELAERVLRTDGGEEYAG